MVGLALVVGPAKAGKIAATGADGKRLFRTRRGEPAEYWEGEE